MTQIVLPNTNVTGTNLWSQVEDNDKAIRDVVNGDIGADNLASGAVTSAKLASDAIVATGAFYAYRSTAQTGVVPSTPTKITFGSERFDVSSWFNTSTSEYTPQKAGYYRVSATLWFPDGANQYYLWLYKNGSLHAVLDQARSDGGTNGGRRLTGSVLVNMNGTTDKLTIYVQHSAGGNLEVGDGGETDTYFCGEFVGS